MKKPAILIPAYNEGKYIKDVILECRKYGNDIIVVDDGSTDDTREILKGLTDLSGPNVILIEHEVNKGKGEALKTGFQCALQNEYCGVVTIDADGQHKVSEIANFLNALETNNPDVIVGNRLNDTKGMPFIRLATNLFTSWLISVIAGKRISDVQSGFRYLGHNVLKNIKLETKNFDTEPEMLLRASWMDYKIMNIPISTIYHKNFVSHVNPFKDTLKFFKLVFKSIGWKRSFKRSRTIA
jgi:glycosyltransferase involved in cell wall biosynthesis